MGDLANDKVDALACAVFGRLGFDREVSAVSSVAERVMHETAGLRPVERAQLWAYLTMPGFAAELSPTTERKYRRIACELGVAVGSAENVSEALVVRLDYETGTEVIRAAA